MTTTRPPNDARTPPPHRAESAPPTLLRAALGFAVGALAVSSIVVVAVGLGRRETGRPGESATILPAAALASPGAGTADGPEHGADRLPPALAGPIGELERRVQESPRDVEGRRLLARALLDAESWVAAFREAKAIEELEPADPDAHYVECVVRLRMGQNRVALEGLRSLVAAHPEHVDGHRALGLALLRLGDPQGAVGVWERGLRAAGGHDAEIERLLAVSRSARRERAPAAG